MHRISRLVLAAVTLGLVATGCDRATAPTSDALSARQAPLRSASQGARLLTCPGSVEHSTAGVIGPEGGVLAVNGFRVDFPAGAVDSARRFVLTVPASSYLEIEVHADGYEHYWFNVPVTVTLNAKRCDTLPAGVQAWYIDQQSKALLEPMGGTVDPSVRSIRFRTPHFSGYSIAW